MTPERKRLLIGIGTTAGAVSVAAGLWFWMLPRMLEERAAEAIHRRTGAVVRVASASVGVSNVVLSDIDIDASDGGLRARIRALRVHTSPFGWVGGTAAVEAVDIRGMEVRWDISAAGAPGLLARIQGAGQGAGTGARRRIVMEGIDARLDDAVGPLLRVMGGAVTRGTERLVVTADQVDLGEETGDRVAMQSARAVLASADGRLEVRELSLRGADLSWAPTREEAGPRTSPFGRLAAVLAVLRSSSGTRPHAAGGPVSERGWLAADMRTHVDQVAVHLRRATGEEEIVRRLTTDLERQPDGSWHVRGNGENAAGGTARLDLEVWPDDLRAEGSLSFRAISLALVLPFMPGIPFFEPEKAHVDGDLVLRGEGLTQVTFTGSLRVGNVAVASQRIAPGPVRGIGVELTGAGTFLPSRRRLTVSDGRITVGRATASGSGTVEWAEDHYLFDVTTTLPPTPCGDAVSSIPRDLLAELSVFSLSGMLSGHLDAHVDSRDLQATRLNVGVTDGCEFVTVPEVADLRRFDGPFRHVVEEPDGSVFEMETGPGTREWTPITAISPFMMQAVLAHEDAGFFRHHGFAPSEIRTALVRDLEARRYVQGASTITMQLVKNLFLRREKTLARKVQEVLLTWWIERALDKARILELYLNVIEYGPGIYGIRHAADHYFGKTPAELTPAECAYLAMILPNPKGFHEQYDEDAVPQRFLDRVAAFLRRELSKNRIDQAALDDGLAELAQFQFHREGDAPTPARPLVGHARPLPIALGGLFEWTDESQGAGDTQWDVPPDDVP